ncbi:MAG: hypothetical protein ABWX84_05540 [Nocardioides sp.]
MTGVLKQTMDERADRLGGAPVDLDAITREGDRRVRRRRLGGLAAGAVLTVAVAGVALPQVLGGGAGHDRGDIAVSTAEPVTYAVGSVIHHDGTTTDVGHPVFAFVQTSAGFVSADKDGTVWSTTDTGTDQVGEGLDFDAGRVLVADGSRAAWLQQGPDGGSELVVVDQADSGGTSSGSGSSSGGTGRAPGDRAPGVDAIDGATVYYRDQQGLVAYDATTGESRVLDPSGRTVVEDAEGGLLLHQREDSQRTVASTDISAAEPRVGTDGGDLSPDARFVMSENSATSSDDFTLLEVATGKDFAPAEEKDYGFFLGYAWSGDDTYTAFGMQIKDGDPVASAIDLLVCTASSRSCTVVERGLDFTEMQFPIGEHVGG